MEKKENFISILITNYNKEKFIRNSIKSILNQNYKNYEIILFDDCSSDNSLKLINDFKKIKIIKNQKKKFKSPSLNQIHGVVRAFKKSRGNLICLLDSDDVFEKNKLKEINSYFHQNHKVELLANLPNDKSYFIYDIGGSIYFPNNFNKCLDKMKNIEKDLRQIFNNVEVYSGENQHPYDKSGKTRQVYTTYHFDSGDNSQIVCLNWSKELEKEGHIDELNLTIGLKEYGDFVSTRAFN